MASSGRGPCPEWMEAALHQVAAAGLIDAGAAFSLVSGGRSNLTFRIWDDARTLVLRRPPMVVLHAGAHDIHREGRIMGALADAGFPAPHVPLLETCEDVGYAVVEHIDGLVLRHSDEVTQAFGEGARELGARLVDALVELHSLSPEVIGMDPARGMTHVEKQLRAWSSNLGTAADEVQPIIVDLLSLGAELADVSRQLEHTVSIVHGDFRVDNSVFSPHGDLLALLDWELATAGNPLADLGFSLAYWSEPGDDFVLTEGAPTTAPGFLTRAEVMQRYADRSGRNLSELPFYLAFGYWKLACIILTVYSRYSIGIGGGDEESVDAYPDRARALALQARTVLAGR